MTTGTKPSTVTAVKADRLRGQDAGHRTYLPQPILRSNLTLEVLSSLERVQEDEQPLWLSFSLERPKLLGGNLTLCHSFPGRVRIMGP